MSERKTSVHVTYLPYSVTWPPMPCRITIYTATGPRHPVEALIERKTDGDWQRQGTGLVNDYIIGAGGTMNGEQLRFTFDCPAPDQYWEIHIQTPEFSPFPNFLDSMIGSCETRKFKIGYPGVISRSDLPVGSAEEVFAGYVKKAPTTEAAGTAE